MSQATGRATGLCALVAWAALGCGTPRAERAVEGVEAAPQRSDLDAIDRDAWFVGEGAESKFTVAWRPLEGEVERNRQLDVELLVFRDGALVRNATVGVRGRMPEHQHGFVQRPSVRREGDSRHVANGVLFHMRGFWQFFVDVTSDGERDVILFEFNL